MIFRNFVLQNFPFLEDDFDALTDYELFCKMVEYMKKSLDKVNEYKTELNEFRAELDSYKNYFDTLDVQEEIDNKLDEMAESGQLTDIIAQYLGLAGVLAFNTVSDMSNADNLVNGSICKCLGYLSYNDGKGCFYKVRTVTVSDVVDGFNIVALDVSDTLIAERMVGYYDIVEKQKSSHAFDVPTIMIGDSYACGESAGTTIEGWCDRLKTLLNLSDDNYHKIALSGYGFETDPSFLDGLQANETDIDKDSIKSIILCGGYNDATNFVSDVHLNGKIDDFVTYCNTNYPNAIVYLGMIGASNDPSSTGSAINKKLNNIILTEYCIGGDEKNSVYLCGVENILHYNNLISTDTIHPTEYGYQYLAQWIFRAYTKGCVKTYSDYQAFTIASIDDYPASITGGTINASIHDDTITLLSENELTVTYTTPPRMDLGELPLCNFACGVFLPNIKTVIPVKIWYIGGSGNKYYCAASRLILQNGTAYIDTRIMKADNSGWIADDTVATLYIEPFSYETSIRNG